MMQEFNKRYEELPIENNVPKELVKVSLPDNWYSSHNSYEILSNKNMKIVKLNRAKIQNVSEIDFQGWDIKNGDFAGEYESRNKIFTRQDREKIESISFFGFLAIVVGVIILISYGIAETIRW